MHVAASPAMGTLPTSYDPGSTKGQSIMLPTYAPDSVRTSVNHLLTRAYSLPCSTAAQAFNQLVQPTSRFQLALDALLPLLELNDPSELTQRILVSFILYSLYAPHPIAMNPFKSVLYVTYVKERQQAVQSSTSITSSVTGDASPNEQLVWVLWKILKGDGDDIGPYSPSTLARSPLPPKLRASNLTLDDETFFYDSDDTLVTEPQVTDKHQVNPPLAIEPTFTPEQDQENEKLVNGLQLLLAARERVLTLSEQRTLYPLISDIVASRSITSTDLAPIIAYNPSLSHPLFVSLLSYFSNDSVSDGINFESYLDVIPTLPPSLQTFDLLGRLLRDGTILGGGRTTIADVMRFEVLGRFVHSSIGWLERAESEEHSDDRVVKGVQNLCRFYASLIKLGIVDPSSDADSAEMTHFSLRNSRFEDANSLYRILASARF